MSNTNVLNIKFGIREKLLLPLFIGLATLVFVLMYVWQPVQLEKSKQQFIKDQTNILSTLSPSLIQNILSNDLSSLHSIIEHALRINKNEWQYVQVTNIDKKQLYPIFSDKPKTSNTIIKIEFKLEENDDYFGKIVLYTDWQQEKIVQTQNIIRFNIITILIFSLIAFVSFTVQTKWIRQPITKLKDTALQISKGNYDSKLPNITNDEIGLLTQSIDELRTKVQTTLAELTDKEKMQRAILESVPDAIITISQQGIIKSFNPGAEKIFQYDAREVIGKNIKMLMPDEIAQHHDNYLNDFEVISKSKVLGENRELFAVRKDDSIFPISLAVNAKVIDGDILFTGVLRDITEQKKINRIKDEFISTVSHELRTPLTAIKGSLELITKGMNIDLPEQAISMLDIANRNVNRLLTLINDILDVSKLESGEFVFNIEPINLNQFINETIELNQEYAKKHHTFFKDISSTDDFIIHADKDRLVQVMSNLLSNAAKYSPSDVPVEIFTSYVNNLVRIHIKDYGPGIPKDFQEKLFDKFTQSDSGDTRQVGGTGLGLSISKMIIEKLGGSIGFKTIENKETTFYFELPVVE